MTEYKKIWIIIAIISTLIWCVILWLLNVDKNWIAAISVAGYMMVVWIGRILGGRRWNEKF
jgi:hypothetical protein